MIPEPTLSLPAELSDKVLHFFQGLPGFPQHTRFVMAQRPEEKPFAWMQSLEDENLTFAVVDAYAWQKDFSFHVEDELLEELGSADPRDYAVYFILRIERSGEKTTLKAHPLAPLVVNVRSRKARQIVLLPENTAVEPLCLHL